MKAYAQSRDTAVLPNTTGKVIFIEFMSKTINVGCSNKTAIYWLSVTLAGINTKLTNFCVTPPTTSKVYNFVV